MKSRAISKEKVSTNKTEQVAGPGVQTILEAMLDSLTVEQQMKMAAYLLRRIKQRTRKAEAETNGDIRATSIVFEA